MIQYLPILTKYGLAPNQIYLIWCISSKNKPINLTLATEVRILKNALIINDKGELTPLGLEIASDLVKLSTVKSVDINEIYLDKYISFFPKIKLPSGKYARVDKKNLKSVFSWFFKTYDYSWDEVLKATSMYVDEYERKGYLYMRNSQYFISKANPDRTRESELANYCALIKNGVDSVSDDHFKEKVV
jgi:hypothetical protein